MPDFLPIKQVWWKRQNTHVLSLQIAILLIFLLLWQWVSGRFIDGFLISNPVDIYQQSVTWIHKGVLQRVIVETVSIVFASLFIGGSIGLVLGVVSGAIQPVAWIINPFVNGGFALPKIALIPLFILWFGTGDLQKLVLGSLTIAFFFYYSGFNGVRNIPVSMTHFLTLSQATFWQRLRILYIPASIGWVFAALRIALPYGFVAVTGAEVVSSSGGLGYLAKNNAAAMNSAGAFSAIFVITLLGVFAGVLVDVLEKKSRWSVERH